MLIVLANPFRVVNSPLDPVTNSCVKCIGSDQTEAIGNPVIMFNMEHLCYIEFNMEHF